MASPWGSAGKERLYLSLRVWPIEDGLEGFHDDNDDDDVGGTRLEARSECCGQYRQSEVMGRGSIRNQGDEWRRMMRPIAACILGGDSNEAMVITYFKTIVEFRNKTRPRDPDCSLESYQYRDACCKRGDFRLVSQVSDVHSRRVDCVYHVM